MIHEWAGFPTFGKQRVGFGCRLALIHCDRVLKFCIVVVDPLGPHRIGVKIKRDEFLEFLAEKLRPTAFKPKPEKKNEKEKDDPAEDENQ